MIAENFILLAADSTSQVIQSEVFLKEKEIQCRIIPLPSEIKASCGLSIKLQENSLDEALKILKAKDVHMEIYRVEKKGLKKKIDFLSSF